MKIKKAESAPWQLVENAGVFHTRIQWLFGAEDQVPHFAMRRFSMAPGGQIPLHDHGWEHEIYVLRGEAEVFDEHGSTTVQAGDALYVAPDEPHGYRNHGPEDFEFLCMVPLSALK